MNSRTLAKSPSAAARAASFAHASKKRGTALGSASGSGRSDVWCAALCRVETCCCSRNPVKRRVKSWVQILWGAQFTRPGFFATPWRRTPFASQARSILEFNRHLSMMHVLVQHPGTGCASASLLGRRYAFRLLTRQSVGQARAGGLLRQRAPPQVAAPRHARSPSEGAPVRLGPCPGASPPGAA